MVKNIHSRDNEQGIALVATLLFLAVMALLSTTLIFTVQNEMQSSAAYKYSQQAFYVADAGIQRTINWYRNSYSPIPDAIPNNIYAVNTVPITFNGENVLLSGQACNTSVFPDDAQTASYTSAFTNRTLQANADNSGVYAVNATLLKYTPAMFINPSTLAAYPSAMERWRLESTGYWGTADNPIGVSRIEAVIENSGNALFDKALWGITSVDLGGTVLVDSYDPALGLYDKNTNAGDHGSVGSNGDITSSNNVDIYGDIAYGPSGSYTGGAFVSGSITRLPQERVFPPIPDFTIPPASSSFNPNNGTITINPGTYGTLDIRSNGTLELNPGVYYVDTISEAATGALKINGPTTIYVKSGLDLTGQGVINPLGDPTELTIYYAGTSEAKFVGGSESYMEVYAPNAPLKLDGNADFFGSFIGKTLTLTGTAEVHFSLGCLNDNLMQQPFRVLSWTQKSF